MSMDDARSGSGAIADSDMSDVTTDDQELAFGQFYRYFEIKSRSVNVFLYLFLYP